jgi:hypothetical protein
MMARKPLDLPMAVARAFAKDMHAYHAEPNTMKRVEIAEHQLNVLLGFQGPQDKELQLHDIIELFEELKDY